MNVISTCKKVKAILAFLVLFIATTTQGQSKLSGKVVTAQEPLAGATVSIPALQKNTITDLEGMFNIEVPQGQYTIEVSYLGFKTLKREVTSTTSNLTLTLIPEENILNEVLVSAVRVKADAPIAHSNLSKKELAKRNLGQDIPLLMNYLPSVVTTSDAGAGVGYTGIRVRGSDATRVNVTINGIPYNDAESQGTFWVNMPDFASSTQNIQLQRGVGTSTNGAGAFGASLNVLTDNNADTAFAEIASSLGSFDTQKYTIKTGTGKLNDHMSFTGRLSKITSAGYIDRASSDLKSYFLQGSYTDKNTLIKALAFGGHEITYQSWNGNDAETMKTDRTFNSAGALYDDAWNVTGYYDNEVDNYKQDHYQLHWNQKYTDNLSSNVAFHYTYGRGFFEQYKQKEDFSDYDLTPIITPNDTINTTDLVRRRWLENDFYGITYTVNYKNKNLDIIAGGSANKYEGAHFGEIIWARFASNSEIRDRYYSNFGTKKDLNVFAKATIKANDKLSLFVDLQNRNVNYTADGVQPTLVDDTFNFFNPKAGANYSLNPNNNLYFSYARAHREPNRGDYESGNPKPERLDDFELGWRFKSDAIKINTNLYYMFYTDQLALTGEIDNVGAPIRANIGKSDRLGLEIDANIRISEYLSVTPNVTWSQNRNIDFKETDGTMVTNLGATDISYSPSIIAGNAIVIHPIERLDISLLSKFVGSQFMSNNELAASELDSYFVNDLNVNYTITGASVFKEITLSGLVNNILDEEYSSNGNMWGTTPYLYPQAGINFLVGATLKF